MISEEDLLALNRIASHIATSQSSYGEYEGWRFKTNTFFYFKKEFPDQYYLQIERNDSFNWFVLSLNGNWYSNYDVYDTSSILFDNEDHIFSVLGKIEKTEEW